MNAGKPQSTKSPIRLIRQDDLKAEIAGKIKISEVAERICELELVVSGKQKKGLCPIHGEDTPSFHVNDAKGLYHCFGCKAGGDAISLVREVRHVGYYDALFLLADEAGVDIAPYVREPTDAEREQDEVRRTAEDWLAGLKPDTSRVKAETARALGVLIGKKPKNAPPGLPFTGTIFPYRSASGKLVGWKARSKDKQMLATPADFTLHEPALFGLHIARQWMERGRLVMVEGEFDTAVCHEYGKRDVAAMGGSYFTDEHLQILIDLKVREVVFWLDGDTGGKTAAAAIAKHYWQHPDIRVWIAICPDDSDPEDLICFVGDPETALKMCRPAMALEWMLRTEWESRPRTTLSDKLDFVDWIRGEYGKQMQGLDEALVLHEVAKWMEVPEADVLDFVRADKTTLQAVDSEKVLLGKSCRNRNYYVTLRKRMVADDFFVLKHKRLWRVLADLLVDGLDFDPVVIRTRAESQGIDPEYVELLMQSGEQNVGWHEDTVIDMAVRRQAREDADRFREVIADPSMPANQLIGTLTHAVTSKALGRGSGAFAAIADQVDEAVEILHERVANPNTIIGLDVGAQFPTLMSNLQGLQSRRLVLVAATSGVGKSTLTLQWCTALSVFQAVPTDFISLEEDVPALLFKMAAHLTGINGLDITGGNLDRKQTLLVEQAMLRIRKAPLRMYAPDGLSPNEFLLYARESRMDRGTEIFVVDYAQMIGPDPETQRLSRYEQIGRFAYLAKQKVARGLDCTVMACAQLKREAASSDRPSKEDMGDSYELVRAADVIVILSGDIEDSSTFEMRIDKNRQGPGGVLVPVEANLKTQTFREIHSGTKEPDYRILSVPGENVVEGTATEVRRELPSASA